MYTFRAAGFLLLISYVAAEIVDFQECPAIEDEETGPVSRNCTVHEIRIAPCPEAADDLPCKLKRGKSARIEFDFTSDVAATDLSHRAYWVNALADLPLAGMPLEACESTSCPVTVGQRQSYSYQLQISKKFPVRQYEVKWKLYQESVMECCFIYKIKLLK